jgi:hypothetical protein
MSAPLCYKINNYLAEETKKMNKRFFYLYDSNQTQVNITLKKRS